jgi:uncharacterized protein
MVHILPHWNWQAGETVTVFAYTNCESVGLFLNSEDGREWSAERTAPYPLVVLSKGNNNTEHEFDTWIGEDSQETFVKQVVSGKGLLVIHSRTTGYGKLSALRALIGGAFAQHPPACPVTVQPIPGHALTQGVEAFTLTDEHYFMDLDDATADVFLTSSSTHGRQPTGWTRTQGRGRIAVLCPGHTPEVWRHPAFQAVLRNAISWCCPGLTGGGRPMTLTALVTGADRGIGSALYVGLLTRGWRVFAGQNLPDWPELPALAAQYPAQLSIVPLDVSSLAAVQAAYAAIATWILLSHVLQPADQGSLVTNFTLSRRHIIWIMLRPDGATPGRPPPGSTHWPAM